MTTVHVEPVGINIGVNPGETVMAAALRLGYVWPTVCHGDGQCSICWMEILDGHENLPAPSKDELETIGLLPRSVRVNRVVRLACQTKPSGDTVVRKNEVGTTNETTAGNGAT